jgi:predicted dehydrogenase
MTVRWGFLGAGNIATVALAPAVHAADGAVLEHVGARDLHRAEALGGRRASPAYDAVLDDPDVDAVYISLSNEAHLPWTLAALEAGKHVLCEKPLGLTADEVRRMADAAAAADRVVVEASWYRWHPRVRLAQQQLAAVGPVQHVSAGFTFGGVPADNYRMEPERGGGALYDIGCYAVSASLWAVGRGLPADVQAKVRLGPTGVDLETTAVLSWDGATAEVRAGIDNGEGQWLVITGAAGVVELRDTPYSSWRDPSHLVVSDGAGSERLDVPAVDAYQVMVEEVSSALEGGPGWVLPLEESLETAVVLDRIRAAGSP